MKEVPFSDPAELSRLRQLLLEDVGLRHVYVPLSLNPEERTTYCPNCGSVLAKRSVFGLRQLWLDSKGCCLGCRLAAPFDRENALAGYQYAS